MDSELMPSDTGLTNATSDGDDEFTGHGVATLYLGCGHVNVHGVHTPVVTNMRKSMTCYSCDYSIKGSVNSYKSYPIVPIQRLYYEQWVMWRW